MVMEAVLGPSHPNLGKKRLVTEQTAAAGDPRGP